MENLGVRKPFGIVVPVQALSKAPLAGTNSIEHTLGVHLKKPPCSFGGRCIHTLIPRKLPEVLDFSGRFKKTVQGGHACLGTRSDPVDERTAMSKNKTGMLTSALDRPPAAGFQKSPRSRSVAGFYFTT